MKSKEKRIIVTGGLGFIGSNFIKHILSSRPDYSVINVDKNTYAAKNWKGVFEERLDLESSDKGRYEFLELDIADIEEVEAKLPKGGIHAILNFAAETHVDRSILDAREFVNSNIIGVYNLIEYSRKINIKRFLQVSTDEIYGSCASGAFTENSPLEPNNPYSATKAGADLLVRSFVKTHRFPAVIVRPSNNFGPWQFPEKAIPLFITNAVQDIPLPVYGDGKNVREWMYVEDNCKWIEHVLEKGRDGEVYNLGGGHETTNIELAKKIVSIMGKSESLIKFVKDRPGHDLRYSLDYSKAKNELGWSPDVDFDRKLKKTVEWYLGNRGWWEKIRADKEKFGKYYDTQYGNKAK